MLRFRNPGTQYSTQVQVIKQFYAALGHQESFSLNDMAVVIAQGRLMTAYGFADRSASSDIRSPQGSKRRRQTVPKAS